ncbi:MAG: hypothetical protein VYA55_02210 [Pseudomonadota bacterium]|nr:hypothetical protein [Pseudomonadota bacterium]
MKEEQQNSPDIQHDDVQEWLKQASETQGQAFDPDQSLRKVLSHAKQQTATRDVMTFFMSWFWMLFSGFGASLYGASRRRHPARPAARRRPPGRERRPAPPSDS